MGNFSIHFDIQHSALSIAGISKCGSNSVVESQPSKLLVAGSIPVSRSIRLRPLGVLAGYGEMPRRSGGAAEEGSLRSPSGRASARRASEQVSREGCLAEARSAKADHAKGRLRRKVVWGS